jgi:hypothetical protein
MKLIVIVLFETVIEPGGGPVMRGPAHPSVINPEATASIPPAPSSRNESVSPAANAVIGTSSNIKVITDTISVARRAGVNKLIESKVYRLLRLAAENTERVSGGQLGRTVACGNAPSSAVCVDWRSSEPAHADANAGVERRRGSAD